MVEHSERLTRAAALFGLTADETRRARPTREQTIRAGTWAALTLSAQLARPNRIAFVTGPSGSGKTTVLSHTANAWPHRLVRLPERLTDRCAIDAVPGELETAVRLLTRAGLADARLLGARPDELSEGERFRLRLAIALAHAARSNRRRTQTLLMIDEFAGTLDRHAAATVARSLARLVRRTVGLSAVIATANDDILEPLGPDVLVWCDGSGDIHAHTRRAPQCTARS